MSTLRRRAARGSGWAGWLLAAAACGGIAQEGSPRNDDPFSTFEPQQPGRRGGGRRGGGGPPAFAGSPAPAPTAPGESSPLPRPPRQPAAPPASGAPAPIADAGSQSCDAGSCGPLTCEPGALRCLGAELVCAADEGSTEPLESCATSCLCELSIDRGRCLSPSCAVGEGRCTGNELQVCNACRSGFDLLATCETAEACNAVTLSCDDSGGESSAPPEGAEPAEPAPGDESIADAGAP